MFLAAALSALEDTHTGYVVKIICDGVTTTFVTPTISAAAAQVVVGTRVIVLTYGAYLVPSHFPAGKVVYCDLINVTTNNSFTSRPILVTGAP